MNQTITDSGNRPTDPTHAPRSEPTSSTASDDYRTGEVSPDIEKAPTKTAVPDIPDGGLRAWLCVLGSWLTTFATFGIANSFGIFQSYYIIKYPDVSASDISWVGSVQLFFLFATGAITGPLYDKGYFYHMMFTGTIIYVVCIFMTSLCKEFWQTILAQALGLGIGIGIILLPAFSIMSQYFMRRRALAMGIAVSGSSTGAIILPIMLNRLIKSHGFEKAVQYTGYLLLGCLITANLCFKTRVPPKGHGNDKPSLKDIFSDLPYCLVVAGFFLVTWGQFFPIYYLQVYGEEHGLPENLTQYTLAILNTASIFGRIIPNHLADHIGSLNMVTFCSLITGAMAFTIFGAGSIGGTIVVAILYGFFSGAYVSLMVPSLLAFAKNPGQFGSRSGYGMMIFSLAGLTGTPIQGALLDRYGFYAPTIWAGSVCICGSVVMGCGTFIQRKRKGNWKV
ncbi:hypothetical protein I302_105948 [Kwoniella bestiolae CBS 10118]|uniref:Major facilitator superfamily (MFS) profile domain-containing protein n=1 Tax=Kwoniella bestiolae CBS 10118 TaxID=1296100 RepID=A0A1B9G2M7_9TREE|nr:hypothetical protein I302_05072 [Kwoniella bestiolae CBS 10118]OCF25258.1 hypothetical protein I302_05072 [Kwoniella bestiolae CBS 10118]